VAIGAAILDSGNVLIRPVSGSWFPHPAFEHVIGETHPDWARERLGSALEVAYAWLDSVHSTPLRDEDEERLVWTRYYELLLEGIGLDADNVRLAAQVVEAHNDLLGVEPYEWTDEVLETLHHRGIGVVILSDAWPSLRRIYRMLRLDRWVDHMVISGEIGITKPDQRAFRLALDAGASTPADTLFVDDWHENVRAALGLGMHAIRLRHPDIEPAADLQEVTDLREIIAVMG
jgi:putative hydrolase of the HAD superfamily